MKLDFRLTKLNWDVTIYYIIDDEQINEILNFIKEFNFNKNILEQARLNLNNAKVDTGFTYTSLTKKHSIIVIHKASSVGEFINTFEHEKNHLEMHICEALNISPYSEEAAILSGYIAKSIIEETLYSIIEL